MVVVTVVELPLWLIFAAQIVRGLTRSCNRPQSRGRNSSAALIRPGANCCLTVQKTRAIQSGKKSGVGKATIVQAFINARKRPFLRASGPVFRR